MINDEGLVLTQGPAERLIEAIHKNFEWVREKGCTVTDQVSLLAGKNIK